MTPRARGPLELEFIRQRAEAWKKAHGPLPKFPTLKCLEEAMRLRRLLAQKGQP